MREKVFYKKGLTYCEKYDRLFLPQKGFIFLRRFLKTACAPEGGSKTHYIQGIIGGAVMRVKVTMACSECKQRNYNTMKNKKNDPDRLEMNKYCRFCRKHTVHRETK